MIQKELYKIMSCIKRKGFREGLRYIRSHIYSTSKFHVFRHSMDNVPDLIPENRELKVVEICKSDDSLINEIYRVWPYETKPSDIKYIKDTLDENHKYDAVCFALLDKGQLVGANWISKPNRYYSNLKIPYLSGEYISYWTFIVSGYRGLGMSKFLKYYSKQKAKQKGIPSLVSLVSEKNIPSIKMNLSVGYKIIGTFVEEYRMFRYKQYFIPSDNNIG